MRNDGDNNEKYVWLEEIGKHPDGEADQFIARLWMAKVRK